MDTRQTRYARHLTILVAIVAMAMSYHALARRAEESGIDSWLAWIYPLGLDGLLAVGMLGAHALRSERRSRGLAFMWGLFAFGIVASGLGNALPLDMPGAFFRLVPPLSLAGCMEALILLSRRELSVRAAKPAAEPSKVIQLPSKPAGSGSARARAILAEHRANGRALKDVELAGLAKISPSRARAVIYEQAKVAATG
jgi:uncharacterized protein DUF2637